MGVNVTWKSSGKAWVDDVEIIRMQQIYFQLNSIKICFILA